MKPCIFVEYILLALHVWVIFSNFRDMLVCTRYSIFNIQFSPKHLEILKITNFSLPTFLSPLHFFLILF